MNFEHIPSKRLITGASGSGKSTLALVYLREARARGTVFIFDHEGELAAKLRVKPAVDLRTLNHQTATGVCLFDPSVMYPGQLPKAWNFFCDYTFTVSHALKGKKLLYCDELQKLNETHYCSRELCNVLETGRRYELDFLCVSQSPNLIHTRVRNQLTEIVTFRQLDERAMKFLEQAGFVTDQVRALPPGQFISRDLITGESHGDYVFKVKPVRRPAGSTRKTKVAA